MLIEADVVEVPIYADNVSLVERVLSHQVDISLATPTSFELVGTSAADSSTGTGARQVTVRYLDNLGVLRFEHLLTNGTSPRSAVRQISRIYDCYPSDFGSAGEAEGDLILRQGGGGQTFATIAKGFGSFVPGEFTVPPGYRALFLGAEFNSGTGASNHIQVRVEATVDPETLAFTGGRYYTLGEVSFRRLGKIKHSRNSGNASFPEYVNFRAMGRSNVSSMVAGMMRFRLIQLAA